MLLIVITLLIVWIDEKLMMIINLKRSVCDDKSEVLKIYEQLTQNIVKRRIRIY